MFAEEHEFDATQESIQDSRAYSSLISNASQRTASTQIHWVKVSPYNKTISNHNLTTTRQRKLNATQTQYDTGLP